MRKVNQIPFFLLLFAVFSVLTPLKNYGAQITFSGTEVAISKASHIPFSIPQNSNSQNQPVEEDLDEDDDQDKKLDHTFHLHADSNSSFFTHYRFYFKDQGSEILTPPPQF